MTRTRRTILLALIAVVGAGVTGCVGEGATPSQTSPADAYGRDSAEISPDHWDELVDECVGEAEMGIVDADEAHAQVALRDDGRWLVSVPVTFQALGDGEQHCVIVGERGSLERVAVDSGSAWAERDFARWLGAESLWFES